MRRRTFLITCSGFALAPPREPGSLERFPCRDVQERERVRAMILGSVEKALLEAIAAAHLPELAALRFNGEIAPIVELRCCRIREAAPVADAFERAGMRPLLGRAGRAYLVPFESLEARDAAWAAFAVTPEWLRVRNQARWTEIVLYKTTPRANRPGTAWPPARLQTR